MPTVLLIVEDDPLMNRMYNKIFTFEGYKVVSAGDGVEGLQKVRDEKPTVILLDIMMPKMNGLEVLDKLKADPETKSIPVVMLTNQNDERDITEAKKMGIAGYIVKSAATPSEVVNEVMKIIKK